MPETENYNQAVAIVGGKQITDVNQLPIAKKTIDERTINAEPVVKKMEEKAAQEKLVSDEDDSYNKQSSDDVREMQGSEILIAKGKEKDGIASSNPEDSLDKTPINEEQKQNPIMKFAQLVIGTKFQTTLKDIISKPGFYTMYQMLAIFLQKFYYNIYTVPNLPNGKCIIVKPETLFVNVPKCNVILPCMKSQIFFTRNPKNEPTRIFLVTNPLQVLEKEIGSKLATVAAIEHSSSSKWKSGDIQTMPYNKNARPQDSSDTWPVYNLTKYEDRFGPKLVQEFGGGDLLAFVEAGSITENNKLQTEQASNILAKLAQYKLLKSRYILRNGSATVYFDPYITPGFPMASLEEQSDNSVSFNIYGYVTTVVHSISDSNWSTTVQFNTATTDGEVRPSVFPVVENDYTQGNISATYSQLFGSADCYSPTNISSAFKDLTKDSTQITDAYNFIRRPATTLEEHFTACGKSVAIEQVGNVMCLRSELFNNDIQEALLKYSSDILDNDKHYPLYTTDIR